MSGYIVAGILIGPYCLRIIPAYLVERMGFVGDIALALIAFGVGRFFKRETLREAGIKVVVITLFESLLAGVLVTVSMHYIFLLGWPLSLLLGAIATSTAPASTIMTINQYHARGEFVNTLLQIVAFDDVVCLLTFSIVVALINRRETGAFSYLDLALPLLHNVGAMGIGFLFGVILSRLLTPARSSDNRLILAIALLLGLSGLCSVLQISPLLSCMVFGAVYINRTQDKELYRQLNRFSPPIMSLFFVVSGMKLDIGALATFGLVGVGYFFVRIAGKYVGAFLGCLAAKTDKTTRGYLGLALVPQAGVAIGLAYLGQRILPSDIGNVMMTITLSSSVLYELIGPACAKVALICSGAIKRDQVSSSPVSANIHSNTE